MKETILRKGVNHINFKVMPPLPCVIKDTKGMNILDFKHTYMNTFTGSMLYFIDDRKVTWRNATSLCTLATPRINFIDGELIAEVGNAHLGMREGDEAWVGYSSDPIILQSVGKRNIYLFLSRDIFF